MSMGWPVQVDKMIPVIAPIFYSLIDKFLDKLPVEPQPGVVEMIDELIRGNNPIVVVSSLPRELAIKALRKSRLSTLFEGRVSPDNLITLSERIPTIRLGAASKSLSLSREETEINSISPHREEPKNEYNMAAYDKEMFVGANFQKWQLTKACSLLRMPSVLTVYIDGNRHNLQQAKRMGLSTIALRGFSRDPAALRAGDKVVDSFREIKFPADIYKMVRLAVSTQDGPAMQQQTVAEPVQALGGMKGGGGLRTLSVGTPMKDGDRNAERGGGGKKSGFADDVGSDSM